MKDLNKKIQEKFNSMCKTGKLFRVALTGEQVWDLYINSFTKENNPVFRDPNSTTHNCNYCNNFIRRYGNIVSINESNTIDTIFDIKLDTNSEYKNTIDTLVKAIKNSTIQDVFVETLTMLKSLEYSPIKNNDLNFQLGVSHNHKRYTAEEAQKFGVVKANEIRTFNHLHLNIPTEFIDKTNNSVESITATYRDSKTVFKRGLAEISLDTFELVRDLINQGSLLDGTTHLYKLDTMIILKKEYDLFKNDSQQDNWCWVQSYRFSLAKFKNELIGTLCSELSEGKEINEAVQNWNKRVDPVNYMKTVAPISQRQIAEAKKFVEDNGYTESFDRRLATMNDIKVSEILHSNVGDGKIKGISIFDDVKATSTRHKRSEFDGVEEVTIDKFMNDILPTCTSVEAFLTNSQEGNLVSLTTANVKESKPIFKWDNNYSWTFNGNLAGKSQIKQAVKSRGGNTEGVVNIRLAFPDTTDDYDLHVIEPDSNHICYNNVRKSHFSSGMLDLDAQGIDGNQLPEKRVENIIYTDKIKMKDGLYKVYVNNFSKRGLHTNFVIEIEIEGETSSFQLEKLITKNTIDVCKIKLDRGNFIVIPSEGIQLLNSQSISKEIYGLETNKFHKVNLICLSPNHWNENKIGNKHYMFMLDGCKVDKPIRSFHTENLSDELLQHKRVLEILGNTTMITSNDKQLSGLGFNSTVRDELILKLQGTHKRMIKIKF